MIVPKSRRTFDPEYKKAKDALKSYIFDTKKVISSIRQLGERAQDISKFYSKMCSKVTEWYPDTTPAIRQSLQSINDAATALDKITTNSFINSVVPSFEQTLKEYKSQTNDLIALQKKRHKAVNSLDQNKEKLRKAQCAREPDDNKIDQLQRKVDVYEKNYTTLNDQFISAVYEFEESRKDKLLHSFKKCISGLIDYINNATQISIIKFPDDPNSALIVDPKTVVNHYDMVAHINQSQPILPPASSNNNYGQQMPTYYQNDYGQGINNSQSTSSTINYANSSGQMNNQGFYPLPPSAGYIYNQPTSQNQLQCQPQGPLAPRSVSFDNQTNCQSHQMPNQQLSSSSALSNYSSYTSQSPLTPESSSLDNQNGNPHDSQSQSILSFQASSSNNSQSQSASHSQSILPPESNNSNNNIRN